MNRFSTNRKQQRIRDVLHQDRKLVTDLQISFSEEKKVLNDRISTLFEENQRLKQEIRILYSQLDQARSDIDAQKGLHQVESSFVEQQNDQLVRNNRLLSQSVQALNDKVVIQERELCRLSNEFKQSVAQSDLQHKQAIQLLKMKHSIIIDDRELEHEVVPPASAERQVPLPVKKGLEPSPSDDSFDVDDYVSNIQRRSRRNKEKKGRYPTEDALAERSPLPVPGRISISNPSPSASLLTPSPNKRINMTSYSPIGSPLRHSSLRQSTLANSKPPRVIPNLHDFIDRDPGASAIQQSLKRSSRFVVGKPTPARNLFGHRDH